MDQHRAWQVMLKMEIRVRPPLSPLRPPTSRPVHAGQENETQVSLVFLQ